MPTPSRLRYEKKRPTRTFRSTPAIEAYLDEKRKQGVNVSRAIEEALEGPAQAVISAACLLTATCICKRTHTYDLGIPTEREWAIEVLTGRCPHHFSPAL